MDLIDFAGPTFKETDNRVAALRLVQLGLTDAAIFDPSGGHATPLPLHPHRVPSAPSAPGAGWSTRCCQRILSSAVLWAGPYFTTFICAWQSLLRQRSLCMPRQTHGRRESSFDNGCCWAWHAGVPQIPMEALYKKNVLLTRGRFRPFTSLHNDMLMGAAAQYFCEAEEEVSPPLRNARQDSAPGCLLAHVMLLVHKVLEHSCWKW